MRALALVFLVACTNGGGGIDGGNPCPAATPVRGASCNTQANTTLCEYRPSDSCIMQASCDPLTFQWKVDGLPGCLPNPSVCASSFAGVPVGTSCTLSQTYICAYPEGMCACEPCTSDAGPQEAWRCTTWTTECPTPRPLGGTACTTEGATCDYSSCCEPPALGPMLQCASGVWTQRPSGACKCAQPVCP